LLTAGHCLVGPITEKAIEDGDLKIVISSVSGGVESSQQMRISKESLHVHPCYRDGSYNHDIGLVELGETIEGDITASSSYIELANPETIPEKALLVSWGLLKGVWKQTKEIKEQAFKVLSPNSGDPKQIQFCRDDLKQSESELCGYDFLNSLQPGDSGGPLLVKDEGTSRWMQIGIAVRGATIGRHPCKTHLASTKMR